MTTYTSAWADARKQKTPNPLADVDQWNTVPIGVAHASLNDSGQALCGARVHYRPGMEWPPGMTNSCPKCQRLSAE